MGIVLVDGLRSPFGSFGGKLKETPGITLATRIVKALIAKSGIKPEEVEEIFFGSVIQTEPETMYLARHIGLHAGFPVSIPALSINRLCGSGMEAVFQAYYAISMGRTSLALAGGVETMSRAPYVATGTRWGNRMGNGELVDMLFTALTDSYVNMPMGLTAEKLAEDFSITREEQDQYAARSQILAEKAKLSGILAQEISPVKIRTGNGREEMTEDEPIRGVAGTEKLGQLPSVYKSEGTVTAGNASPLNDGASAMLVASDEWCEKRGIKPLARILGIGVSGCDPAQMGLGPVYAIPKALQMAGLELKDMELIEVNEAFAAQILAVKKLMNLNEEILNVNGGAIAIGHPLGASGNRLLLTLSRELQRRKQRYGLASLCIGGGQGIATVLEAVY